MISTIMVWSTFVDLLFNWNQFLEVTGETQTKTREVGVKTVTIY